MVREGHESAPSCTGTWRGLAHASGPGPGLFGDFNLQLEPARVQVRPGRHWQRSSVQLRSALRVGAAAPGQSRSRGQSESRDRPMTIAERPCPFVTAQDATPRNQSGKRTVLVQRVRGVWLSGFDSAEQPCSSPRGNATGIPSGCPSARLPGSRLRFGGGQTVSRDLRPGSHVTSGQKVRGARDAPRNQIQAPAFVVHSVLGVWVFGFDFAVVRGPSWKYLDKSNT